MRESLKSSARGLLAGWFWPLVLLALPNCGLQNPGWVPPAKEFDAGPQPHTSAIMCDLPKYSATTVCATSADVGSGISMSDAAVALVEGRSSTFALDYSKSATQACGGLPQKIDMYGKYPDGYAVCLNCGTQIPAKYGDPNAVCLAVCTDMITGATEGGPNGGSKAYCQPLAHISTNFDDHACYDNACGSGGALATGFVDPRRTQEPVKWVEQNGASGGSSGNSIARTAARSGNFDAGGFSAQTVSKGDGWVEFEVSDNTKAYTVGLSTGETDGDETQTDIGFGILLAADGRVYVLDKGLQLTGSDVSGSFGTYAAGERFRVKFKDKNDGSSEAAFTAVRIVGTCTPGTVCTETAISGEGVSPSPTYPLRVDVSLVDPGATVANATLVRIQ
jgi:hypothetical protein